MLKPIGIATAIISAIATPVIAQERTERVQFARGTSQKVIKGGVRGYDSVNYMVGARAGQRLNVSMRSTNGSNYFNVLAPGSGEAMFAGSTSGNSFSGRLPADGDYRIQVYLMRNAARRNESGNYTLTVGVR